jgi:hypothetical protein
MRPAALEGRVLAAVEALRSGVTPEDDFTECKARWPEKTTARQLAGLANRAAGEPIIYIVGVHDKTGQVTDPGPTDPNDWWAGMRGQFDQTPPDIIVHMQVFVEAGEAVHAYAFDTSRAPYVVKTSGSALDVPYRDSTGTRSAHRHELVRMLLPTVNTPPAVLLHAQLSASWRAAQDEGELEHGRRTPAQAEIAYFGGNATCFFEHIGPHAVMLPTHGMKGSVQCADWRGEIEVSTYPPSDKNRLPTQFGVEVRSDGIVISGPGTATFYVQGSIPLDEMASFEAATEVELSLMFDVVGSTRAVHADGRLTVTDTPTRQLNPQVLRTISQFRFGAE